MPGRKKVALELYKLSLEIEKLEQEKRKKLLEAFSWIHAQEKLQYQYTSLCRRVLATLTN